MLFSSLLAADPDTSFLGGVTPPPGVDYYNQLTGSQEGIGILVFFSLLIRVGTIIAGLYVFINLLLAGYTFISSDGSANVYDKVKNQVTASMIGLILIVSAYTIMGIVSYLFFGDPRYILNPQICPPGATC